MHKLAKTLLILATLVNLTNAETVGLFYDHSIPQFEFAASDIEATLESHGFEVEKKPISKLTKSYGNKKVVLALQANAKVKVPAMLGEQAYVLRTTKANQVSHWVIGGDVAGVMYGGLDLAERISVDAMKAVYNDDQTPYLTKRGIKFNIPLDYRVPSMDSDGDQDKANIKDIWELDFWKEYFDTLARHRFNVMTYWNRHQFPAMIKLEDYPDVALEDVYDGYGKLVKKMTMNEKIAFWQEVMEHAHNRCIDIYFIYANLYMTSVEGKYGITEDCYNPTTNDYLRKSVAKFLTTYPYVNGIGVTAGEHNMKTMSFDEREKWLWNTYAEGMLDAKKDDPEREIRFIHRYWFSSVADIVKSFKDYPDPFEFSFKYARAHMFSSPHITFEDFLLEEMPEGVKSWWNLRNDDMFYLRWGDPEYARDFILNFPKDQTAGYYIGADGYIWARTYNNTDPAFNGQLENKKHWYNFMLWGRLGYNPHLPASVFKDHLQYRFPEVPADTLYDAWKTASKIVPQTTRFFWRNWDYEWYVEGCKGPNFITVQDFMNGNTMEDSGILNIADYCERVVNQQAIPEKTPVAVADALSDLANSTLCLVKELGTGFENAELKQTVNDIIAFARLGQYYSEKIRAATELGFYSLTADESRKEQAVVHLQKALGHWKNYAAILTAQYLPRDLARHNRMDWNQLTQGVEGDIELARNAERYQLDISFGGAKDGDILAAGSDLSVTLSVESTFDVAQVYMKVNGEDLVVQTEAPYQWDGSHTPLFKGMTPNIYRLRAFATDKAGNEVEKEIKIVVK
ncbi:hypothetical protein ACFL6U_00515 [Planctomycetota bacterium]